jgi:hypothetical protein
LQREGRTFAVHGLSKTRLGRIADGLIRRCHNPRNHIYKRYGGRGITVCDEWRRDWLSFYRWALSHGYRDDLEIDRIDNDKGSSPENCRWVTTTENQNNKRNNIRLSLNGETDTLANRARKTGIQEGTIRRRLRLGWPMERALLVAVNTRNRRPFERRQRPQR